MWIVKGISLAFGLFLVGALIYMVAKLRPLEATKATSVHLLLSLTLHNSLFWIALVACIVVGCVMRELLTLPLRRMRRSI